MSRYAIIDERGIILNVIEWDGERRWTPPTGTQLVALESDQHAEPDGTFDGKTFSPAPVGDPPPPTIEELVERLDKLQSAVITSVPDVGVTLETAPVDIDTDLKGI